MVARTVGPKNILSLDIGYQNIKALVTEVQEDAFVCHHAAVVAIPRSDGNTSLEALLDALKKELTLWKFDNHAVRVCLSGDSVTVRFIQVPNITKAQLLANISYESSKYIPFPLKDTYFDCDVFAPSKAAQENKTMAVIAAAKRDAVGDVAKILHAMGFFADLLDVSPVALFNAFEVFGAEAAGAESTSAVLDVGCKKSHLGIVHEGTPAFSRDLDVGSWFLNMPTNEPKTGALGQQADPAMPDFQTQAERFQRLAQEIRDSLRFFEAQQGVSSGGMVVTGGGALMEGLGNFLQQVLEIPVGVWNPFDSPKIRLAQDLAATRSLGPMFSVCLGMAARKEGLQ